MPKITWCEKKVHFGFVFPGAIRLLPVPIGVGVGIGIGIDAGCVLGLVHTHGNDRAQPT
jgi:hypothetical protein